MKKIIAINASPRTGWNTAALVREAAQGAEAQGAQVKVIDLYKLEMWLSALVSKAQYLVNQSVLSDKLEYIMTP